MSDIPKEINDLRKNLSKRKKDYVSAILDKDALTNFFYLFASKPDSILKSFYRSITINKEDIKELNEMIIAKLKIHSVEAVTVTIVISLLNNTSIEFGDWDNFLKYEFREADAIEYISMKWDILFNIGDRECPQRHSLIVRLATELSPIALLQAIINKDSDFIDNFKEHFSPCTVKVDFVNPQLSEELIQIVDKWNKGRRKAVIIKPFLSWLKRKSLFISSFFHYFFPTIGIIISSAILFRFSTIINKNISFLGFWLILSCIFIFILNKIGDKIGNYIDKKLMILGKIPIFQITNGDKTLYDKIEKDNHDSKRSLLLIILLEIMVGTGTSLLAAYLFNLIK